MLQDFRTKLGHEIFGVRATALIIKNGQIYLTKNEEGHYYSIGGAIQVGKKTQDAVKREVEEEIGIDCQVNQLAFVVENQFQQGETQFHNIEFHYLVTPFGEPPSSMMEGERQQECQWVDLNHLSEIDLVPAFLKEELPQWDGQMRHIVSKYS